MLYSWKIYIEIIKLFFGVLELTCPLTGLVPGLGVPALPLVVCLKEEDPCICASASQSSGHWPS